MTLVSQDILYAAMARLEPQADEGALVSVRALRMLLGDPLGFDAAVIGLADAGRVALHHTAGEPLDGRQSLVRDGADWVIGIARR